MKMKNINFTIRNLSYLWIVPFVSLFIACSSSDDGDEVTTLEVTPTSISLDSNGQGSFIITSNTLWVVNTDASWLSVSPKNGKGNGTVTVSATTSSNQERSAAVTVSSEGLTRNVLVKQSANSSVTPDPTPGPTPSGTKGSHQGHEWVDLGLSVYWATTNVGANSASAYGSYFAWGETSTKTTYNFRTYKFTDFSNPSASYWGYFTKYCNKSGYGDVDGKTILEPDDDAATVNWGGSWRMPTFAEMNELLNNCTWEQTSEGGHKGYLVTGTNGNSIFLPLGGAKDESETLSEDEIGYYWTSTLSDTSPLGAMRLMLIGWEEISGSGRQSGLCVRPVYKP